MAQYVGIRNDFSEVDIKGCLDAASKGKITEFYDFGIVKLEDEFGSGVHLNY